MESTNKSNRNSYLPKTNAITEGIEEAWTGNNEQWWNWYVSLADNSNEPVNRTQLIHRPKPRVDEVPSFEQFQEELNETYPISDRQIEQFQTDSYIRLKNIFSPGAIYLLRQELQQLFNRTHKADSNRQFSNMEMMWLESDLVKAFVFSKRLGQLAADLLKVSSVRIYHDDFLCKEPGCGRTPWHYDGHHYPIASNNVVTLWMPLQPTPKEMGPLEFAKGIETYKLLKEIPFDKFSQHSDGAIAKSLQTHGIVIDREPFQLGEISFQHCLNVHGASANYTTEQRLAFGLSYFENGARVINSPTLVSGDWQKLMPGIHPSEVISSCHNPVVYEKD